MGVVDSVSDKITSTVTNTGNDADKIKDKDERTIKYRREEFLGFPVTYLLGGGVLLSLIFAGLIGIKVFLAPPPQSLPPIPQIIQQPVPIPVPQQRPQQQVRFPQVRANVPLRRNNNGHSNKVEKPIAMSTNMENELRRRQVEGIPVYYDNIGDGNGNAEGNNQPTGYGSNSLKIATMKIPIHDNNNNNNPIVQTRDPHARRVPDIRETAQEDDDGEYEDEEVEDDEEEEEIYEEESDNTQQPQVQEQSGRTVYAHQNEVVDLPPFQEQESYY